ncbi:efflux RND transporter periplasmic adaptor subunit [Leptolyngbya sp. FACHB-261]|uniref:efflux RND transporter periplasmic adaptor subunit n=1 Tax=Leptolyngbya sp. FACHB-261 TaxID=2692806 RepID=UPI0018F007D2|nr:efflux RND transporter periplasmic adaptor subunit [Leptolyngbya sp. FACHB-261]
MTLDSHQSVAFKPSGKGLLNPTLIKWCIGLFVLAALAGGGYLVQRQMAVASRQEARRQMQTVPVERASLPITITANGTVQAEQSTNVSPKTSGRLRRLLVNEGDEVQSGQILAYMDDSNLQGQLIQSKGQLASAQANLQKVIAGNRPEEIAQSRSRLRSAEASLNQAQFDFQRNQQLYQEGAVSAQALDTARTARDNAQAAVDEQQQALRLTQVGSRPEDISQARAQVTEAQGSLRTVQTQIADTVIRAPFIGIVTSKYASPGDFVTPTTSGSSVSSATSSSVLSLASNYQVIANVAETDIGKIKIGQLVNIQADAYSGQAFKGKVAQIAAQATVETNVTSFKVRVDFADPQKLLRPGMNVNAQFDVGKLNNALVIPTVAIVRQQNGTGVLVMTEAGRPRFRPVETGVTVGNQTEVRSGLTGNEQVLVSAPRQPSQSRSGGPSLLPGFGGGPSGSGGGRRGGPGGAP